MSRLREDASAEMTRALKRIAFAILCLSALAIFGLWRIDNPRAERIRMAVTDAAAPSLDLVAAPTARIAEALREWEDWRALDRRNRDLRREVQRLRAWRDVAQELERENARLRALNNVRLSPRTGFATAEVIADSGGPFGQSVLVNIGAEDGVSDGAAAVDGAGLVGRVVGVGERVSRVLLLTDFDSRVPVKILPGGERAVLSGDATAAPRLAFLADIEGVGIGDRIATSGDGGVFPPDLAIGVVAALGERSARVRLAADYQNLEFVRVLRWRREAPVDAPGELILPPPPAYAPPPLLGGIE